MTTELQEKELLQGLAQNSRQAVETIYRENYAMVRALVTNNSGLEDDARDIFQEAMVVLYEKACLDGFELNCRIGTYLYSVSRRLWLKKLQQAKKYTGGIEGIAETVPVEEDMDGREQQNRDLGMMENALLNLGEPCKSLIKAFYMDKKNMADIAGAFGYTNADTAKNQKYKCLMRLKKLFFSQYKISERG
ncbi:MAG TPA: sigma-70 family RNA polymerase sigma factor [Chitinophagaceae bacterium]|nr:sigma-70 family RNA polymerase sigma factor [Chitinophagaceae bacterium]